MTKFLPKCSSWSFTQRHTSARVDKFEATPFDERQENTERRTFIEAKVVQNQLSAKECSKSWSFEGWQKKSFPVKLRKTKSAYFQSDSAVHSLEKVLNIHQYIRSEDS